MTKIQINYSGSDGRHSITLKPGTTQEQAKQIAADLTRGYAGANPRITTEGSKIHNA